MEGAYAGLLGLTMVFCARLKIRTTPFLAGAVGAGLLASALACLGDATGLTHDYAESSVATIRIGDALYEALPIREGNQLDGAHPLAITPASEPFIGLQQAKDVKKARGEVVISAGMLDFLNHIAHAKAADRVEPGYFAEYLKRLGERKGKDAPWPEIADDRFWTLPVKNRQMSLFNQMVSLLAAINLSHYYLGHYAKHAPQLASGTRTPRCINLLLSPSEWEDSVKAGAINSMVCAFATQGAATLFEAVAKMPQRPDWAACLAPPGTDLKALSKELTGYETNFYQGDLGSENRR